MTDLDLAILKLRVRFHKRLADHLGLKANVERIEKLIKHQTDEDVFRLIEIENQKKEKIRLISPAKLIRIARESWLIKRLENSYLVGRFKTFIGK
ncbi:hypothetical protein ACFL6B_03190 [Thermodesulfobacteriota bacterium]